MVLPIACELITAQNSPAPPSPQGEHNHVEIEFIQPGKPSQNGFIERFNGTYRDAVLNAWVFTGLAHVREETERWLGDYNTIRPRESLGDISPIEFLTQLRGQMA